MEVLDPKEAHSVVAKELQQAFLPGHVDLAHLRVILNGVKDLVRPALWRGSGMKAAARGSTIGTLSS